MYLIHNNITVQTKQNKQFTAVYHKHQFATCNTRSKIYSVFIRGQNTMTHSNKKLCNSYSLLRYLSCGSLYLATDLFEMSGTIKRRLLLVPLCLSVCSYKCVCSNVTITISYPYISGQQPKRNSLSWLAFFCPSLTSGRPITTTCQPPSATIELL